MVENSDNVLCVCGTNILIKIWIFLDGAGTLAAILQYEYYRVRTVYILYSRCL